jgi:hypothetical protein
MSVEPNSEVTTRAEIASLANLDCIRDVSVGYRITRNLGHVIQFRCAANISQISFSKTHLPGDRCATIDFPNIRHLANIGFAQSGSIGWCASTRDNRRAKLTGGNGNVRGADQGPSMPKMRRNDGVADHRA